MKNTIELGCLYGKVLFTYEDARQALRKHIPSFDDVPSVIATDSRDMAWRTLSELCQTPSVMLTAPSMPRTEVIQELETKFCSLTYRYLLELKQ